MTAGRPLCEYEYEARCSEHASVRVVFAASPDAHAWYCAEHAEVALRAFACEHVPVRRAAP